MKQKFVVEIETPNSITGQSSAPCSHFIQEMLNDEFRKFYSRKVWEQTKISVSEIKDKPLIPNVLPFTKITLDHTEDKGFHIVKQPLQLQGIAWDKPIAGDEENNFCSDVWRDTQGRLVE